MNNNADGCCRDFSSQLTVRAVALPYIYRFHLALLRFQEERFLFPVYPLICLCGAVTVDVIQKIWFRFWVEGQAQPTSRKSSNAGAPPTGRHYLQHTVPIMIAALVLTSLLGLSRILTLYKGKWQF